VDRIVIEPLLEHPPVSERLQARAVESPARAPLRVKVREPEHAGIDEHMTIATCIRDVVGLTASALRMRDTGVDLLASPPLAANLAEPS